MHGGEDVFLSRIALVSRRLKSEAQRRLAQHGVHSGQQFVLGRLWERDGLTPGEIAAAINVEAPTVTRAIQRMVASGLLRVAGDQRDGRRVRVWLTPRGDQLRNVVPAITRGLEEDALALLSEQEQKTLDSLLERIGRALDHGDSGENLPDEEPD
ncbi:MarR family winged helix-turn-helix transcriptional regulator [Micromonospora sp. WMMD712]|uniref:MarR family winged helix-turn-helix transcriptional regulator n=1 Tax=Micromonospora sp. WMMD712 TaxID=3016096 RepID=UPI00249BF826|nr:MarR family winged helix-turn-helix transcriptional regulator [Micromonospora sp. WMMD712]WFE56496.1 MarR family winged helix-turn-helix transcriptional regulator [Micromonospora sp. WMMD712]